MAWLNEWLDGVESGDVGADLYDAEDAGATRSERQDEDDNPEE